MSDFDALLDALADKLVERMASRLNNGNGHAPEKPDELLTVDEAAKRLGVKPRWLYGHDLPFAVRLPNSRAVRFSERGIAKWLAKRMG